MSCLWFPSSRHSQTSQCATCQAPPLYLEAKFFCRICCLARVTNEREHSKDGIDQEALSPFISVRSHESNVRLSVCHESKLKTSVSKSQRSVMFPDEVFNTVTIHNIYWGVAEVQLLSSKVQQVIFI